MQYRKILLWISLFGMTGIANFFSNKTSMPFKTTTQSSYSIENNNLKVNINEAGAVVHSIIMKKWNNSYHKTPEVLLNRPSDYKSCLETGFHGDGFPDRATKWNLVSKTDSTIVLRSVGTKHTVIRTMTLANDSIKIQDNIGDYQGLAQHYFCISGSGEGEGKFFIKTKENHPILSNLNHHPGLFNLYKKSTLEKTEITNTTDVFGIQTEDNFVIAIRPQAKTGSINYFSDPANVRMYSISTVDNNHETEIFFLPNLYSNLKQYDLQNIRYYGWLSFISKPMALGLEKMLGGSYKLCMFFASILIFTLILTPFFWWALKRKQAGKYLEMKLMKEAGGNFNPQMIVLKMFKFHIITLLATFLFNAICFYYFLKLTVGDCFYMKYTRFLWIHDLSGPDTGSIFNLYGLLGFNVPGIISHFGILKVWFMVFFFIFRFDIQGEVQQSSQQAQPMNQWLLLILALFLSNMYGSAGQIIGFCSFLFFKEVINRLLLKISSKNDADYHQL